MSYQEIEIERIRASAMNPRKSGFCGPKFDELVGSIRKKGVLQPIVVRPRNDPKGREGRDHCLYEIVAGERRFRAASKVAQENGGLEGATIPAMVRDLTDDEAFEVMTIENLQREDLTELEEAHSFKAYLDRKGEDTLPELAERTGIDARYIRRRIRVLTLPKEILQAWEKGRLKYGHLEQLRRLEKPEEIKRFFREALDRSSVEELKRDIDQMSILLGKAWFKTSEAGCKTCPKNSACQKDLFGTETDKARCLDPNCFMDHQKTWLTAHWDENPLRKKYGTNGFRFRDYGENLSYEDFWGDKPKKECKACADYVTILSHRPGEIYAEQACLNPACYRKTYPRSTLAGRQYEDPKQRAERRSSEQGILFRENFFRERIPQVIDSISVEDSRTDQLILAALLFSNHYIHGWFYQKLSPEIQKSISVGEWNDPASDFFHLSSEEIWKAVQQFLPGGCRVMLHEAIKPVLLQRKFGHDARYRLARYLGMDLQKEWRLHEDYLKAKTTKEMLALGESLGIFKDPKAQAFLYEKLGKKRGKFEACKKTELIRVFLESGVELAGKVPAEILVKERTCKVCGCTDDHACPGGCFWIEKDLCSSCAEKSKEKGKRKKLPKAK